MLGAGGIGLRNLAPTPPPAYVWTEKAHQAVETADINEKLRGMTIPAYQRKKGENVRDDVRGALGGEGLEKAVADKYMSKWRTQ